jgi:hypothetical protein
MTNIAPLPDRPTVSGARAANGRPGAYDDDVAANRAGWTRAVPGPVPGSVPGPVPAVAGADNPPNREEPHP